MQKFRWYFLLLLGSFMLLAGCSSTHQAYYRSLKLALDKPQDVAFSAEHIINSPADLIYVKRDELANVALALAFIEQGHYKWVSVDNAVLVEQNGRIQKTLGLDENLDYISATNADPLLQPESINENSSWHRTIDFSSTVYGLTLNSRFHVVGQVSLDIENKQIDTVLIEETVSVADDPIHDFNDKQWLNQFWLHKPTGQLLRSRQKLLPGGSYFDIRYVSRALRL